MAESPIGRLLISSRPRREAPTLMKIIAYIDESGTHGSSKLIILGGYVARLGQWATFDQKFRRVLKRSGLTYYHSKEMRAHQNEFKSWSTAKTIAFCNEAHRVVAANTMCGFSIRIDRAHHDEFYVAGNRPRKMPLDTMYGVAFRLVLSFIPEFVQLSLRRGDLTIDFILEDGAKNIGDARRIFQQIKEAKITGLSELLGTIEVGEKKQFLGLQAADALASGAYLEEQRGVATADFPVEDRTLKAARKIVRAKSPVFRISTEDGKLLAELKDNLLALIEMRRRFGMQRHAPRDLSGSEGANAT